ncbi:MAG: hypothetical protein HKO66_01790 [Saprospiraceae bacterium]|nr:hypothetical protein [Bacteroidia bacterium]NNE14145.1 hypothetical protein [Saprospiraceae bacterium]NNL90942.1 hypothetical protein [Saprospiraceae bacterium]
MNKITTTLFLLLLSVCIFAQDNSSNKGEEKRDKVRQKMEAKKIAFISDELELTPEEAQTFWPLYNAFHDEMKSIRSSHQHSEENKDYSQALVNLINDESQRLTIKKSYVDKFSNAVGPEKTFRFFNIDRRFKREMLEGLKRRKRYDKSDRPDKEKMKSKEGK